MEQYWDRFWKDKNGNVVVAQKPNALLVGWIVFMILSWLTYGSTAHVLGRLASLTLAVWALLEIISGASPFRRVLGVLVLLLTAGSVFGVGL